MGEYREIALTQGQVAWVDIEDYDRVSQFKWCAFFDTKSDRFYAVRTFRNPHTRRRQNIFMHRFVMGLMPGDGLKIDHIEIDRTLDNRKSNLRLATASQNGRNRIVLVAKSGYQGVYAIKSGKRFHARIGHLGKQKYLGSFASPDEAHEAYKQEVKLLFGEFARFS